MKRVSCPTINIKEGKDVKVTEQMVAEAEEMKHTAELMLWLLDYLFESPTLPS